MQVIHIQDVQQLMHLGTLNRVICEYILRTCILLIFLNKFDTSHFLTNLWGVFFLILFSSRVFLLGPSHHYYTPKCALSKATIYSTPVGDLPIDVEGIWYFRFSNFITRQDIHLMNVVDLLGSLSFSLIFFPFESLLVWYLFLDTYL